LSAGTLLGPEPLGPGHDVATFDCGVPTLNDYLARQALADQRADKTRTFVATRGGRVAGFFSLAAASVEPESATTRLAKGQGTQSIPVILLARLAVDLTGQGHGVGRALLVEALARCAQAADVIGARAVLVHAKTARARIFYESCGFEASPTNPLHLVILMKDVRRTFDAGEA